MRATASFALVSMFAASALAQQQRALPNIVILFADDMGYGDLHANNPASRIPTPRLDAFAAEGLRCTDAHSSSGICTPSRYALLTGRHHWRQFHDIVDSFGTSVLLPGRMTIADMLRQQGYRTACIGKWHLGWDWDAIKQPGAQQLVVNGKQAGYAADAFDWTKAIPGGPLAHGFMHYFGDDVPNFPPYAWILDDRVETAPSVPYAPDPKPAEGSDEGRPGPMVAGWKLDAVMPRLVQHAVQWIGEQKVGQPFFLYMPFTSPHAPIVPSAGFRGKTEVGGYGDWMLQTDAAVGAVLDALDHGGFAANTVVIFASDNGPEIYALERVRKTGHQSMGGLRGIKRDIWEGGHRTPFVVRWPGVIEPGVSDALLCQTDVMATLAAVVGAKLPADAGEDSFDQLPVWRGELKSVRTTLVHNTYAKKWAVRSGDWLLIDAPTGGERKLPQWFEELQGYVATDSPQLLFDLRQDLGERHDLSGEHADKVAELRALLQQIRGEARSAPR